MHDLCVLNSNELALKANFKGSNEASLKNPSALEEIISSEKKRKRNLPQE
jgi:hypothetical protein